MMPWIKVAIISTLVSSIVSSFVFYYHGKSVGENARSVACMTEVASLKEAVNKANLENIRLAQQQRDSYRIALDLRNKEVSRLNENLTKTESELRKRINESEDSCVTARIPDSFK